jgi:hypothetical protein
MKRAVRRKTNSASVVAQQGTIRNKQRLNKNSQLVTQIRATDKSPMRKKKTSAPKCRSASLRNHISRVRHRDCNGGRSTKKLYIIDLGVQGSTHSQPIEVREAKCLNILHSRARRHSILSYSQWNTNE